jgi:hypothetical protein
MPALACNFVKRDHSPYIVRQPHRLKYFRNVLARIRRHRDVVCRAGGEDSGLPLGKYKIIS